MGKVAVKKGDEGACVSKGVTRFFVRMFNTVRCRDGGYLSVHGQGKYRSEYDLRIDLTLFPEQPSIQRSDGD
jgi:hypothetical protein